MHQGDGTLQLEAVRALEAEDDELVSHLRRRTVQLRTALLNATQEVTKLSEQVEELRARVDAREEPPA